MSGHLFDPVGDERYHTKSVEALQYLGDTEWPSGLAPIIGNDN